MSKLAMFLGIFMASLCLHCFASGIFMILWAWMDVGEWTKLGNIPFSVAFFISLMTNNFSGEMIKAAKK